MSTPQLSKLPPPSAAEGEVDPKIFNPDGGAAGAADAADDFLIDEVFSSM